MKAQAVSFFSSGSPPANAAGLSLAFSVACDWMAASLDAAVLFHVDMDHPARLVVFVARDGRLGFEWA